MMDSSGEFAWADNQELRQRVDGFAATMPDYCTVVNGCHWSVSPHMEAYLRSSKNGPQLSYYLAKHLDLYAAVLGAQPVCSLAMLLNLDRQLQIAACAASPQLVYAAKYDITPTPDDMLAADRLQRLFAWDQQVSGRPS